MYEHVTHHKTISIAKGSGTIINESINVPRRSIREFFFFFISHTQQEQEIVKNLLIQILMK